MDKAKKRVFSAIQPSGTLTIGNYFGALKNHVAMQEDYDCIFSVADLHAITVKQEPEKLYTHTLELYAIFLAVGLDPEKSIIFIQSHVPAHTEFTWLLNCFTQFGELSRMHQFKEKSKTHSDNINAGLFDYPVLMAADILLYNTELVPTGQDQKQHIELARNVAQRVNGIYGDILVVPEPYIPRTGAKITSLQDPSKKMSKSDSNANAFISILDEPDVIIKKFKRDVTDSEALVKFDEENKPGVSNLMNIYSCATGRGIAEIEKEFDGRGYGDFKMAVAQSVVDALSPIQAEYKRIISDKAYMSEKFAVAAERAADIANDTLRRLKEKIGFYI